MSNQRKKILTITTDYKVWQEQFFRARIAFACKLSMVYFGISGLFNLLFLISDRSEDIWALKRDLVVFLLSGFYLLAIKTLKQKI